MSDEPVLPEQVRDFVLRQIDSVAEVEALMLMRAEPAGWDATRLGQRLYIPEQAAAELLEILQRRGFVSRDADAYAYAPVSSELRAGVDALASSYTRFLIPITHLIHSKSPIALRRFADAFRLRGDK